MSLQKLDEGALVSRNPTSRGLSKLTQSVVFLPIRLSFTILSKGLGFLRPISPQLVPLVVCLLCLPLLLFASLSAGWIVWRTAAVGWEIDVYLQYGDGVPPYAEVNLPKLVPQQPYDISLHLVIPATESNFVLGNFMTTLTLSTLANDTLTTIRRPTIALPPSINRWSLISSPPNVVEFNVALLTSYAVRTSNVIAKVQLGRQDGWKSLGNGEGREISILSASIRGVVRHRGLRGLITRFPLLVALASAFTFFGLTFLILAACMLPVIRWQPSKAAIPTAFTTPAELEEKAPLTPQIEEADTSSGDEKPPRRLRRSRRSRSRSIDDDTLDVKTEAPISTIPSADPKSSPSRRRRRRSQPSDSDT